MRTKIILYRDETGNVYTENAIYIGTVAGFDVELYDDVKLVNSSITDMIALKMAGFKAEEIKELLTL